MLTAATTRFKALRNNELFSYCFALSNIFFSFCLSASANAAEATFLGQNSCSASSCHGGAGPSQNQQIVWSKRDPHSRAPATLTTARSATLARGLGIKDATRDRRCTECHSPWTGVSSQLVPTHLSAATEAISCETCHGPASEWYRSHTRPDLDRGQKVLDGLRDLTILYNRANVCVACHQKLDPDILNAGHPELIFELDGQTAAMPRHWREQDPDTRPKAWLTGQAAALREMTAQLLQQQTSNSISPRTFDQWQALLWIVTRSVPYRELGQVSTNAAASTNSLRQVHELSDKLALSASTLALQSKFVANTLLSLAKTSGEFAEQKNSPDLCSRAERLVISLDRLLLSSPAEQRSRLDTNLIHLFRAVQNRQAFDPAGFASQLRSFESAISGAP